MISFEKSIGAIVFRRENNQIKYSLLEHEDEYWNFPKGHSEIQETGEATLRREVAEETGITELKIYPNFQVMSFYFYRAKGEEKKKRLAAGKKINIFKKVVFYLAKTQETEVQLSLEHQNFAWLEFSQALQYLKYSNLKKALNKANSAIKKILPSGEV